VSTAPHAPRSRPPVADVCDGVVVGPGKRPLDCAKPFFDRSSLDSVFGIDARLSARLGI